MKNILKTGLVAFVVLVPVLAFARLQNPIGSATDPAINAEYINVRNADNVTHEVGTVVVFKANATYPGVDITTTTTANNSRVAGVIANYDCAASASCLVQVSGYHSAVFVGVATSTGDALVTSTTGEYASVYTLAQATGTASGEATSRGVFGIALETTTSSTTVKALIFR
jgi:hypothetical protein